MKRDEKSTVKKKLQLKRETLRSLSNGDLSAVQGAGQSYSGCHHCSGTTPNCSSSRVFTV